MPKPTTKQELLSVARAERQSLEQFLAALSPEQMVQPGAIAGWSVKDVLAHLVEWEQMFLSWYAADKRGEVPHLPAEGFNWGQLPALNHQIYEKHRNRILNDVLSGFRSSYEQVLQAAEAMPEEELFTAGRYAWAGQNKLAAFVNSVTGSHYRWARTEMRKGLKSLQSRSG